MAMEVVKKGKTRINEDGYEVPCDQRQESGSPSNRITDLGELNNKKKIPEKSAKPKKKPQITVRNSDVSEENDGSPSLLSKVPPKPAPSPMQPPCSTAVPAPSPSVRSQATMLPNHSKLIEAAIKDQVSEIDKLLSKNEVKGSAALGRASDALAPIEVNEADADGYTALHHAARQGSNQALEALLKYGADMTLLTRAGATALMVAAKNKRGTAVEILLEHDKFLAKQITKKHNIHWQDAEAKKYKEVIKESQGQENLRTAVLRADFETAARMIASGNLTLDDTVKDVTNACLLLGHAAKKGEEAMVRLLLCADAKVDASRTDGTTPLMHAVWERKTNIVGILLHANANPTQTREDGASALTLAVRIDSSTILESLVGHKKYLFQSGEIREALLFLAIKQGSIQVLKHLLQQNGDLPDENGNRALAGYARKGMLREVETLLKSGADINHRAHDGHTAFTLAAANGHLPVAQALLKTCEAKTDKETQKAKRQLLNQADNRGRTALMLAALNGHKAMLGELLQQGADIHQKDLKGRNAMFWAIAHADDSTVSWLSNNLATYLLLDHKGRSGIMCAAKFGNLKTLEVLLSPLYRNNNSLYDVNTPDKKKNTALTIAAAHGHMEIVNLLLKNKANVLHVNGAGRSAKLEAAAHGHTEIVELLETEEQKAFNVAQSGNNLVALLKMLSQIPMFGPMLPQISAVDIPEVDGEGNSALALAARHGKKDMVAKLINPTGSVPPSSTSPEDVAVIEKKKGKGSSPSLFLPNGDEKEKGTYNNTSSQEDSSSSKNDNDNDNEILIKRTDRSSTATMSGPSDQSSMQTNSPARVLDLNRKNKAGMSALCEAVAHGEIEVASLLIEHRADVNHASNNGRTPLWLAASMQDYRPANPKLRNSLQVPMESEKMMKLLIESGADINKPSIGQETPLHAAAASGQLERVTALLRKDADIEARDKHGVTPLGYAASHGHASIVEYLIGQGADIDATTDSHAPLTLAAAKDHVEVVKLLKHYGADVDYIDIRGYTALIAAAMRGQTSTVKLLLGLGARMDLTCQRGDTALEHATKAGHADIVALLQAGHPAPRDK